MDKIVHKDLSYLINGLLYKTHRELGAFRNEQQYCDYFENLLKTSNLIYIREYSFVTPLEKRPRCRVDFLIDDKIILEFKAKSYFTKDDYLQTKRYLVTLNLELGILVNFRQQRLSPKRVLSTPHT